RLRQERERGKLAAGAEHGRGEVRAGEGEGVTATVIPFPGRGRRWWSARPGSPTRRVLGVGPAPAATTPRAATARGAPRRARGRARRGRGRGRPTSGPASATRARRCTAGELHPRAA